MTPLLKRIRLDFDAAEDQKGPFDGDRKKGPPQPLGFRCSRRHGSFSSMSSCPLFPRNFRGGKNLRPLRLDFDAAADTARLPACLQGPARPVFCPAPGMTPLPGRSRLDFDAAEDPKGPLYRSGTETLERPSLAKISWAFSLGILL